MSTAPVSAIPEQAPFTLSGEVLTRRAVTAVTASIMVITFAFSLGNVTRLCLLCRRRHNRHYAEVSVMPIEVPRVLVAGQGVLSGVGIITGFQGRPGGGRAGGSGRGLRRAGWSVRVLSP